MSYQLDAASAKAADTISVAIKEPGKYVGVITRAESLLSQQGTKGLGLSFRAADGSTADYLDIYTHKADGEPLFGAKTVNAILACLKLRQITEGRIKAEKWNPETRKREPVELNGYPELMGKRIGFLFQKVLETNERTGADVHKLAIFGVFSPDTELTASEILEGKTNPERLAKMVEALAARPVRDSRNKPANSKRTASPLAPTGFDEMDDDIPF